MNNKIDQIYRNEQARPGSFKFDSRVAEVFSDMISRSVPGYQQILEMLPTLTRQFSSDNGKYYDLGCSLGAGMLAMSEGLKNSRFTLIGVDNSTAMIEQAVLNLANLNTELHIQDLVETRIDNATMVLMNFTLQFIPIADRALVIDNIYTGLNEGGAFILSEKIKFDEEQTNQTLIDIHHQYKADQGYSELEIAQKRDAIENILIPETLNTHTQRLRDAGFRVITPWVQNLQFISILAIK
jgi:tRNA (cmo5U34)-methyltransferase